MSDDYVQRHEMEDLEDRLAEKFAEIEEVREQNSRLSLDAAWGIVPGVNSLAMWGVVLFVVATSDWPWWGNTLLFLAALFGSGYFTVKANEERMKEVKSLWRIKPWGKA